MAWKAPVRELALIVGGVNIVGYGCSKAFSTQKLTDAFGTGAFVVAATTSIAKLRTPSMPWVSLLNDRRFLASAVVTIWGSRLGSFLFYRIMRRGEDERLTELFKKPFAMEGFWLLQAVWGVTVMLPVYSAASVSAAGTTVAVGALGAVALACAGVGLAVEALADGQKFSHKIRPSCDAETKPYVCTGLFALCRYPNYLGEMTFWTSIYAFVFPVLFRNYSRTFALICGFTSPFHVFVLLRFVSGIPPSEKRYDERFGDRDDYRQYKKDTPLLIPKLSADTTAKDKAL